MSYEVLARRLRPTTFDDVVGQSHATTTLRNALLSDRLPHALLLCGPRGVGKTSIARILARSLNCDSGPTDKPCGSCRACTDIASGTSMDVQEIDAASHTGVENVREIRESIRFSAAPGKHRIFIIDEVHMLSQAAFNALLKTLEEPPPRSLFIFATTDPQKMPVTVLSRVQRFDLRRIPAEELLRSLEAIAAAEQLDIPESVLRALIREGEGSFRDVLTLLDRLVSGLGTTIDEARANEILGWIDRRYTRALVDAVLAGDPALSLSALEQALDQGADPARLAADVLEELRDLLVVRLVAEPASLIDATPEELGELRARAEPHSPETLQRIYRVLLTRIPEFGYAPRPAHALEVAIVRLATLPSAASLQSLLQRLDGLEPRGPAGPAGPSGSGPSPRTSTARPRRGPSDRAAPTPTAPASAQPTPPRSTQPDRSAQPSVSPARPTAPAEHSRGSENTRGPDTGAGSEPASIASTFAEPPELARETEELRAAEAQELSPAMGSEPQDASGVGRGAGAEEQRALRIEAKSDPIVLRIIESLDAEIREIRFVGRRSA